MDRPAKARPARHVALVLDTLTAVPWFVVTPLVRPWHLRWGATAGEVHGSMPGDEVVRRAQFIATRAVTVDAPPDQVWPWIVQSGRGSCSWATAGLGSTPTTSSITTGSQAPSASSTSTSTLSQATGAAPRVPVVGLIRGSTR
jgi:hypothetical protein